jgi:hypothetical protein
MAASPADQVELKVKWSLERLQDGNDETQQQNASYLAGIPSTQVQRSASWLRPQCARMSNDQRLEAHPKHAHIKSVMI